jgi:hypothetical protein
MATVEGQVSQQAPEAAEAANGRADAAGGISVENPATGEIVAQTRLPSWPPAAGPRSRSGRRTASMGGRG